MAGKSALILGATGAVGRHLLKELLNSTYFTRVGEFGRRTTPKDTEGLQHTEKLFQKTMDYEKLDEARLTDEMWDVVFITMGTTRKQAGGMEGFIKVDQDYVVNAAKAAKHPQHEQRLVYLSSSGANTKSYAPYLRSKGQTEERLASLGYSDTIVFRPGMLMGRDQPRALETVAEWTLNPLTALSDNIGINVRALGKTIRIAGELGSAALPETVEPAVGGGIGDIPKYTVISNKGSIRLAGMQ